MGGERDAGLVRDERRDAVVAGQHILAAPAVEAEPRRRRPGGRRQEQRAGVAQPDVAERLRDGSGRSHRAAPRARWPRPLRSRRAARPARARRSPRPSRRPRRAPGRGRRPTARGRSATPSTSRRAAPIRRAGGAVTGAASAVASRIALNSAVGVPLRPDMVVGELAADGVIEVEVLDRPGPVPRRVIFVARLVVAVGGIVVGRRLPRRLAAVEPVHAAAAAEHRHAQLGEAEMVGAEIAALLGTGFGRDVAALPLDDRRGEVVEARLVAAAEHDIVRLPADRRARPC